MEFVYFDSVQAMNNHGWDSSQTEDLMYAMRKRRLMIETQEIPKGME